TDTIAGGTPPPQQRTQKERDMSQQQINPEDVLKTVKAALEVFRDELGPETNISKMLTLLGIADSPGVEQHRLGEEAGVATSTLSRIIVDLSGVNRHRKPGPNVVHAYPDPMWRRRNLLELTSKGRSLMDKVTANVNKALK
ncbi:MAG: MarR family winged helix-turn-helix transcriptional regulator, partial [Gillisia sp.]